MFSAWSLAAALMAQAPALLKGEPVDGEGVWIMPVLRAKPDLGTVRVTVWFDEQLLGDGLAYLRRAHEFAHRRRRELRAVVVASLKDISNRAYGRVASDLDKLIAAKLVREVERHWILSGFSCTVAGRAGLDAVAALPGVKKVFRARRMRRSRGRLPPATFHKEAPHGEDPAARHDQPYLHPWYTRSLLADRVWREFGIRGQGTLNVVHDGNFILDGIASASLYRNPEEVPGNHKDDDGNGLIDDYHGYNFVTNSPQLTVIPGNASLHGTLCASIICGTGSKRVGYEMGIAPQATWAGVIAGPRIEAAIEWAIQHGADTYSMSFSIPGLGNGRSHWRKLMEHGSLCGVYFVSGAGNFAQRGRASFAPVPVQMRTPEDIPDVVFAAAGVRRDLSRTPFSSKGPVEWKLEHYRDGRVQKPEVCAFNSALPAVYPDGKVFDAAISGNSFAGPMFCGAIALMLSADPDLLPWDLKQIITSTALDVGPKGVDFETGHGLINCYRAVKEVLRRRALRDGGPASKVALYAGRVDGDELDVGALRRALGGRRLQVRRVRVGSPVAKAGVRVGDILATIDGRAVRSRREFAAQRRAAARKGKARVRITFVRGKQEIAVDVDPDRNTFRVTDAFAEPAFR